MDMPVRTYSSGMKSKLAFGLSMAIGFDFYLIDEAYSVGDAAFQAKGERVFQERKASSTLIVVSLWGQADVLCQSGGRAYPLSGNL